MHLLSTRPTNFIGQAAPRRFALSLVFLAWVWCTAAFAQALDLNVPADPLRRAYFGDLHLHTGNSLDSAWARVGTTPTDAYRYAQGFAINYFGKAVKRKAPLDFLAVSDHAEYMGVAANILRRHPQFENSNWYQQLTEGDRPGFTKLMASVFRGGETLAELNVESLKRENWAEVVRVANEFNQPGRFTSLVAFEWSDTPGGSHHHRVAIFRGPLFPELPFSALDSRNPLDLWRYADALRARGVDSVLIPHNSNLSGGLQFSFNSPDGQPMSRETAEIKARNEGLVEITQLKGTSETHPILSPTDEFAGFEILDHYIGDKKSKPDGNYVRQALGRGLEIEARTGINPYRFGFVGASDAHSATSVTEEDNYTGGLGDSDLPYGENAKTLLTAISPLLRQPVAAISASGITGVWAEQNTREAIFAAFKRKEVFATSGPRLQVRMFAGWAYPVGLVNTSNWIATAYAQGVPMGGTLNRSPTTGQRSPRFLVQALKEPDGANLDRIQIIKVWRSAQGPQEEIFDVVWSPNRAAPVRGAVKGISKNGGPGNVGNTVEVATASYQNTIGSAQLSGEWVDPEFDPKQAATYYSRVIEIPTPRWSTHVAVRNGLELNKALPATLQERAWTSPIFYAP